MLDLRRKVLIEYNGLPFEYSRDRTILHLIEDQARRTPDLPAIVWKSSILTYRELSDRSAAWAAELRASGVTRGDLIPVVSDGGPGFIIAIIAVMKCAGAFVLMDWVWPPRRLQSNIAMLGPHIVITTGPHDGQVISRFSSLHVDAGMPAGSGRVFPGKLPAVDDLIYGYFTSGSTGEPKCSLNRHLGLLNRFLYMTRHFGDDGDVVLQNSSHVFDSSVWQLLWPLIMGGATVLPQRKEILDLSRTIDVIERHSVTMTDFVPSVFNTFVHMLIEDVSLVPRLGSLCCLFIGGEVISLSAVGIFRSLLPGTRIVNTYGPTEASIGCVFHEVSDLDDEEVPIGRPIDNTYVALLDNDRELVVPGEIGEIHLGGDCLGAGYLHAPDRITDVFINNPFGEIPGSWLYPTGDLAYHRHDGQLIFVGRRDHTSAGGRR